MHLGGPLPFPLGGDDIAPGYWGPHFPDHGRASFYWGPHFPDGTPDAELIPGVGPAGAVQLALDIEIGAQLTLTWQTQVFKAYDGGERRVAKISLPKQKISGPAYLLGDDTRAQRARLARYAAIGGTFLIGLPYEELAIASPAVANVVPVGSTALVDWAVLGGRVIIKNGESFANASIQAFDDTSLTLDIDPGDLGLPGGTVMPTAAIFLEPQQAFARYPNPDGVERWDVRAQMLSFGFESDGRKAFASLSSSTGALKTTVINYFLEGPAGNAFTIEFIGDASPGAGNVTHTGSAYQFHFNAGTTTVANAVSALAAVFGFTGSFNPANVLVSGDIIGPLTLANGADKVWGTMGAGETLVTHYSRPVWDRVIQLDTTATDSVQSLSQIVDLGGKLANIGAAKYSDWGRQVMLRSDLATEWQWLKLFLSTVRGMQKAWWLATWRADLTAISHATGTLVIDGPSFETGDFFGWYPTLRTHLQVQQADGTLTLVNITAAVDNGDGTITLSVETSTGVAAVFASSAVTMVSWLELVRFDSDEFVITFKDAQFSLSTDARAVQI